MSTPKIFKYPDDIDSTESAYMVISAYPYEFKLQKPQSGNGQGEATYPLKQYLFHFISYIPKELAYNNNVKYGDIKAFGIAAMGSDEDSIVKSLTQTASTMALRGVDAIAENAAKQFSENFGIDNIYKTAKEQVSLGTGIWPDPRIANVFQAPSNVSQSFTFTLLSNSKAQADEIKLLAMCFKYAALPYRANVGDRNDGSLLGEIMPFLKSPMNFDILVMTPNNTTFSLTREYDYMNLESVDIKPITDQSRVDVPFYSDGNVVGYEIKLGFKSMHSTIRPDMATRDDDGTMQKAFDIINGKDVGKSLNRYAKTIKG